MIILTVISTFQQVNANELQYANVKHHTAPIHIRSQINAHVILQKNQHKDSPGVAIAV